MTVAHGRARLLVANLFVETNWARLRCAARRARGEASPIPLDPRYAFPEDVMQRIAALGTLFRAAAEPGDELWLPREVDAARMADVPGLARPALRTGARPEPFPTDLQWGDPSEAAARVNDRTFALAIEAELGGGLPAVGAITAEVAVEDAVRAASEASPQRRWMVKAVHSSSGRGRIGGEGPALDDSRRRAIAKLLDLHGTVIVEPWMPRLADFAATATAAPDGTATDVAFHVLHVASRGEFRGIDFPAGATEARDHGASPSGTATRSPAAAVLTPDEHARLAATTGAVASRLAAAGYSGPFGIDAFRWRTADGSSRFRALCEINARWTFGRIARALAARLSRPRLALRVGDAAALAAARAASPSVTVLLHPAPPDDCAAWIADA